MSADLIYFPVYFPVKDEVGWSVGRGKHIPSVFYHPGHFLRRAMRSGNDEVPFVLPVFVVHYDKEFTGSKGGKCVFYWVERECGALEDVQACCGPP